MVLGSLLPISVLDNCWKGLASRIWKMHQGWPETLPRDIGDIGDIVWGLSSISNWPRCRVVARVFPEPSAPDEKRRGDQGSV